jgi:hypothetical protein
MRKEYMSLEDMKYILTVKVSALDTNAENDRLTISRLYETLTGDAVSNKNPDNLKEVSVLKGKRQ